MSHCGKRIEVFDQIGHSTLVLLYGYDCVIALSCRQQILAVAVIVRGAVSTTPLSDSLLHVPFRVKSSQNETVAVEPVRVELQASHLVLQEMYGHLKRGSRQGSGSNNPALARLKETASVGVVHGVEAGLLHLARHSFPIPLP